MLSRVRCTTPSQSSRTGRSQPGTNGESMPAPISHSGSVVHISTVSTITSGATTTRWRTSATARRHQRCSSR